MAKLPAKIEDWTAPWEKDGADEFDAEKAKGFVYSLLRELETAKDGAKDLVKQRDEAQQELEKVVKSGGTNEEKLASITAQLETQKAETAEANLRADRTEVAAAHGLTPAQAKRLSGKNREELETDAAALAEEFGLKSPDDDEESGNDQTQVWPSHTQNFVPHTPLTSGAAQKDLSPSEVAAASARRFAL